MAKSAVPSLPAPPRGGVGSIRRLAGSIVRRPWARPSLEGRLRGALPLRHGSATDDASLDADTGLAGQPVFVEALDRWSERFAHEGQGFSLALLDIDLLGLVNTRDGHVEGDRIVSRTAEVIRAALRPGDRAFRIGGDEFAVLMAAAAPDEAMTRTAQMLATLEQPVGDAHPGTFSAGVAGMPWATRDPADLYRMGAAALIGAKRRGPASITVFDPDVHALPALADQWSADLVEKVVSERLLRPVFQPIVDLHTGYVLGFEGLVRVASSGAGTGARELFTAAAAAGRLAELDLACIEAVVGGARAISADRLLTINLSARTLAGRDFEPGWLLQTLVQSGISASRVVVEVSDGEPVDDLARLRHSLTELQRFGLRVAADDVSIDDPSRRLLTHLPFDIVKIDLSEMWEGAHSGPQLAMLRDTALSRQARVVAEGVETSEQLVAVRDLQIGAGQGYLLGRPDTTVEGPVVDMRRLDAEAFAALPRANARAGEEPTFDVVTPERHPFFLPPAQSLLSAEPGAI